MVSSDLDYYPSLVVAFSFWLVAEKIFFLENLVCLWNLLKLRQVGGTRRGRSSQWVDRTESCVRHQGAS